MDKKILIRLLVFVVIVILGIGGGWLWWLDATSAVNPVDTSNKIFVVSKGEGVRSIASRLKAEHLIKDPIGFFLTVKLTRLDEKLQAGDFRLSPSMNLKTLSEALTHGSLDAWVTILEGWRNEEIALKLAQALNIPETEFTKVARQGYMFPDTYLLPKTASASAVSLVFENNFAQRVTPLLRNGIVSKGLTFEQGITLASIVEREGDSDSDRPTIAAVLLKRFKNDWPLQADATIQYILGYQPDEKSWWKKTIFDEDKKIKSAYNTYIQVGLPPTPICNPGLASITAVAAASDTPFWYYLHDTKGEVHFAKTLEEHNSNVRKYLQQ